MAIRINDTVPNFRADTTQGPIDFHGWLDGAWAVFVSHPKDFTPICTTELGLMARMQAEFNRRGTKLIGHSIDPVSEHLRWMDDIEETQHAPVMFPIIGDEELTVAKALDMLPADAVPGKRSAADNATVRHTMIIGPDKKIKIISSYPMTVGRNFDEVLRVLDSLQLTARTKLATPVNWKPGDECVIPPSVSDDEAAKLFPGGWRAPRPWLRILKHCETGALDGMEVARL